MVIYFRFCIFFGETVFMQEIIQRQTIIKSANMQPILGDNNLMYFIQKFNISNVDQMEHFLKIYFA